MGNLESTPTKVPSNDTGTPQNELKSPSPIPGPSNDSAVKVQPQATVPTETKTNSSPPPQPMEVEDNCEKQCNSSGVDVDSGIENMEVEESDRKDHVPRSRVGT